MGKATGRGLHVDVPLSNVAINYTPMNMIAGEIAPIVPVAKQADSYVLWDQGDIFRIEDDKRSPGTEANKLTRDVSSAKYYAENYALKMPLTLEDRENMDEAYIQEMREGRVKFIKNKLSLGWEQRVTNLCTSGANVYSYSACASAWTGFANADPISDLTTCFNNIEDATGYRPNRMVMGNQAWRNARYCDAVIDALGGGRGSNRPRFASREEWKALWELDYFGVGGAYYNSADEGQSQSLSSLWGDHVLIYYAPMAPSREEPSFMYTMRWRRPGIPQLEQVERHPFDRKTKSEEIEVGYYQDEVITASALAFLFTNVTSST